MPKVTGCSEQGFSSRRHRFALKASAAAQHSQCGPLAYFLDLDPRYDHGRGSAKARCLRDRANSAKQKPTLHPMHRTIALGQADTLSPLNILYYYTNKGAQGVAHRSMTIRPHFRCIELLVLVAVSVSIPVEIGAIRV